MENISENDKIRISNILKAVYESLSYKINSLEKASFDFESKLSVFNPKLLTHLKKSCIKEFDWIEKNGIKTVKDGVESMEIKPEAQGQAAEKFKEWEACTSKHDFGLRGTIEGLSLNTENLQRDNENSMNICLSSLQTKSDDDLKKCFTSSFDNFFTKTQKLFDEASIKVNEIDKKI